MATEANI